jgi:hypothetical protein
MVRQAHHEVENATPHPEETLQAPSRTLILEAQSAVSKDEV